MTAPVVITGGLGYVGGRIARALLGAGVPVRITTRRPPDGGPAWSGAAEVLTADIFSADDLDRACRGARAVIHLAALNEHDSLADPGRAIAVNCQAAVGVLDAAVRNGVERFVYFSTAHIYGAPLAGVIDEKTPARPVHPYAITHFTTEHFVRARHERGEIAGVVLRLSNGLGAPADAGVERWTLLGNDLCRQAATGGRLVLRGSGAGRRNFIALADVADATAHVLDLSLGALGDGVFNLGGEVSMSILEVAELIIQRCDGKFGTKPALIGPAGSPAEETPALDYRIEKLRETGFSPRADLAAEIDATLDLCREAFAESGT